MSKGLAKQNGVALFMVLGTLLIVVILANIALTIISSQARLTHHQVSRIQAYYAGQAALNIAFEKLRKGEWATDTYTLCKSGCSVNDTDIPYPVSIQINDPDPTTGIRPINITTNYTYQP